MPTYEVIKTVNYDVTAMVDADSEEHLRQMLDSNLIEFDSHSGNNETIEIHQVENITKCTWCGDEYETTMWTNHNCLPNKEDVVENITKIN